MKVIKRVGEVREERARGLRPMLLEIESNLDQVLEALKHDESELNGAEAIYGFCGWLTTRENPITMSRLHEANEVIELVDLYVKANNLTEPRDGWENKLEIPNE